MPIRERVIFSCGTIDEIDGNRYQLIDWYWQSMDNRSRKFLWLLIIIDYQYQSIIDGNRSINIIIPHGRSRWTWASAQTHKERRRKRNNKLNRVWTTTASQGQLNLCNELAAKSIKFVLLTTRFVNCLNYLCCFSPSYINE